MIALVVHTVHVSQNSCTLLCLDGYQNKIKRTVTKSVIVEVTVRTPEKERLKWRVFGVSWKLAVMAPTWHAARAGASLSEPPP